MSLEPGPQRPTSPESSGRETPNPARQWRNQLSAVDDAPTRDKAYRKYAAGVDRALTLFETALQEWADYISFLNRLLKALQARTQSIQTVPAKTLVAKRLSQCLNPALPSGVHQKTLEVYNYVFTIIGRDGLSRDLPLYLPGLAPTLSFASLSVRTPFLDLLERHFLELDPRSLRPAMKSVVMALLPGLEEETAEDFDRTLKLLESFKQAIRPPGSEEITPMHSMGDDYFWQCVFLASITGQSRRTGALSYLVRSLPKLGHSILPESHEAASTNDAEADLSSKLAQLVTTPEPGLLLRCFAAGLADEQLLIQRGFLDLLVTHLPLHSKVLQKRVKHEDLELLLKAAAGVVLRREMSLNRRLWTWLLGPEPSGGDPESGVMSPLPPSPHQNGTLVTRTRYFEDYGLEHLTRALLSLIKDAPETSASEKARPYRVCLSLMDRWEIGGLVVPEVFLPIVNSVRSFKDRASSKTEFAEVLRSASTFFDGVESGLIYGEILGQMAQAIGPGDLTSHERSDKFDLVQFIFKHFNIKEEEMITVHAPLTALAILCMIQDARRRDESAKQMMADDGLVAAALGIVADLLDIVPDRAFPSKTKGSPSPLIQAQNADRIPSLDLLLKIRDFYVQDQGNLDVAKTPLTGREVGELLLQRACDSGCDSLVQKESLSDLSVKCRILMLLVAKTPQDIPFDHARLLAALNTRVSEESLQFTAYSSILSLSTRLYSSSRIEITDLSDLASPLVRHAWSFLAASEPRYHVETVRSLWLLQTVLTPQSRDIEAALCALMRQHDIDGTFSVRPAESGRSFSILWSHSLQDNPSGPDRRTPKTPVGEAWSFPRLSGIDNYEVMLTRPLFLVVFYILTSQFVQLPFLVMPSERMSASHEEPELFTEDDDLDLCIYYLRTISNIFRWAPDAIWGILATKTIYADDFPGLPQLTNTEEDVPIQFFLLQVCLRCISQYKVPENRDIKIQVTQLVRSALLVLHQILLNPYAAPLAKLQLEDVLINRLAQSLESPDPYVQVLLLDVVYASLKLREVLPVELPPSPTSDKRRQGAEAPSHRGSVSADKSPRLPPPPPALLKCLQAGLSSPSSRPVLDSWISFLTECLPYYADSIFQVLIPLVGTLCDQIGSTFTSLEQMFRGSEHEWSDKLNAPETTLISFLNGLEHVLAKGHDRLLLEEARTPVVKGQDQPQGFFGNMVSGVFSTESFHSRSATANDRLTVLLAFQDAVRICFKIWSWGQGGDAAAQNSSSVASFSYTSLRMRNRARRLLEHLFAAETLECLETVIDIWRKSLDDPESSSHIEVFNLLPALDGSRPKHTVPAIFNSIYSRTNPNALDPTRKSNLTVDLQDTDIVIFLVDYAKSLEDDAMDEIWQDCITFLKDLLTNPFPHRQTLPSLLEFAAILGEKVDNTNFGEQRKMRRELGDLFLRLLTALFTTRPVSSSDGVNGASEKPKRLESAGQLSRDRNPQERADDTVGILSSIVPNLPKILVENDRVLQAATSISASVIGPALRAKAFPDTFSQSTLVLLQELSRLPGNQKTWKKDVTDAFNDTRFFGSSVSLVQRDWLPLLRQWTITDKDRMPELLSRIAAPTTAGIVFGVGATSARLEADRKTQLTLRRMATLILATAEDTFVTELPSILDKLIELLAATATSSPSSTTRAELFMVVRALALKTSAIHLAPIWPVLNTELHAAISSVATPDHSSSSETYNNLSVLQACKLLDLLVCVAPDDFQLHEWLFVTDTIDAVYRPTNYQPFALVDELSEELGSGVAGPSPQVEVTAFLTAQGSGRRPLLGDGGIRDDISIERREELVAKILRPFFGQLSIFAFESTYAMGPLDREVCIQGLLKDLFDEASIVKQL
ncbi:putative regulator of reproduction dopa [Cryphonectria parasitica EP155]|uniref:Regulator of reproduction dopa n=1 Tax=Cryphonectria parasitica (strain ATCC 38755 / EP155) TaxID=660469 RepID=A0A9P5CM39_CRYP1|nr:putative regulator of reproduction dopa [Cryphonectria parasitica EP155]KAF3762470.1 putative regulator of reproduction dopa [Cryphonectria parasitica EP155]